MSVVCHEVAHGVAALWQGDDTALRMGRLTLNPLPHLDMVGSIFLPLILVLSGSSVVFGWAKPVPFVLSRLRNQRWGPALVALAGPITNIILALIGALLLRLALLTGSNTLVSLCVIIVATNTALALFNLIPLPPLDGHHVLIALFGKRAQVIYENRTLSVIGTIVAVFVVWQFLSPVVVNLVTWLIGA
jgi:Zn-dependent protease